MIQRSNTTTPGGWVVCLTRPASILAVGGAAVLVSVLVFFYATSDRYGTLVRNSLSLSNLAETVDWRPGSEPDSFIKEVEQPPEAIRRLAKQLKDSTQEQNDPLALALAPARFLDENTRVGGAIRRPTLETLRRVKERGEGYCADYTQLYLVLTHALGLYSREWGFGEGGFGGGHAFNEVFVPELDKWVFVDSFNAFYVRDSRTGQPLSVMEFHEMLGSGIPDEAFQVVEIGSGGVPFKSHGAALDYYRGASDYFYLLMGNNVIQYETHPAVLAASRFSRSAELLAAILVGVQPRILPVPTPSNIEAVRELSRTRNLLVSAAVLVVLLTMLVCLQIALRTRYQRRNRRV